MKLHKKSQLQSQLLYTENMHLNKQLATLITSAEKFVDARIKSLKVTRSLMRSSEQTGYSQDYYNRLKAQFPALRALNASLMRNVPLNPTPEHYTKAQDHSNSVARKILSSITQME